MTNSITLHGVFMKIYDMGILLNASSGDGKSELALELIQRGHQLIADDAPIFNKENNFLIGTSSKLLQDFLHTRSLGFLNIRSIYGDKAIALKQSLNLIINLKSTFKPDAFINFTSHKIMDIVIPTIMLSLKSLRLCVLIECAVKQLQLLQQGYNAATDLQQRQLQELL